MQQNAPSRTGGHDPIPVLVPLRDLDRLIAESTRVNEGVLPDVKRLSLRGEYRKTCGWCIEGGKPTRWSERLGKVQLLAQYRAAAMLELWLERLQGNADGQSRGKIVVRLHPRDDHRRVLKRIAWRIAQDRFEAHTRFLDEVLPPLLDQLIAAVSDSAEVPDHVTLPPRLVRERLLAALVPNG
jgi:hypothetical protein